MREYEKTLWMDEDLRVFKQMVVLFVKIVAIIC